MQSRRTVSPVSPVITAFARVADVRDARTPQLRLDAGDSEVWLIDLGAGRNRIGGSALMQVFDRSGGLPPDVDSPPRLRNLFALFGAALDGGFVLACHDRSDGGAIAALVEMALAGHCGLDIALDGWADNALPALFSEELGLLVQVRSADHTAFATLLAEHGLADCAQVVARPCGKLRVKLVSAHSSVARWPWEDLMAAWSETSHAMQRRRDNPATADAEHAWRCDEDYRGIVPKLGFDPAEDISAAYVVRGTRPRVAILRDQGVNGQVEMAAAFTRAGFDAVDVHMTDLQRGLVRLADFAGLAAGGGFSYGDVLGAGRGWAASILHNAELCDQFAEFFADPSRFALGACNGCQMLSQLKTLIPGAEHWPQFVRNASEQYEARLVTLDVMESPSILFRDMVGSRIPVVVAHGEGRAQFERASDARKAQACLRYVDARGGATEQFPLNPNGSAAGLTGFTAAAGRVTVLMPHPERAFRSVQMSWRPPEWGEDSPWMRMFRNARAWVD
jgi:phosphoribosylformylglycinamidine synthase